MKRVFRALPWLGMCVLPVAQPADILPLTAAQIKNLGIRVEAPGSAADAPAQPAFARVVIPPSSVRVIAASGPALVTRVHVQAGDAVKRGAPLLSLSMPGLAEAQNGVTQARLRAELAAASAARDRRLFDEGLIAESRLRATESEAQSARASLAAAQTLRAALGVGGVSGSTLTLIAPITGVVSESRAEAGLRVDAGTALLKLVDPTQLALEISLSPDQARAIAVGQRVRVQHSNAQGTVLALLPQLDAAQRVLLRASLHDPQRQMRPGQAVEVELSQQQAASAHVVPVSALVWRDGAPYVFVYAPRGFAPVRVSLVRQGAGRAEITGLAAGARVAVTGVAALKAQWLGE
ncbi:MAG: efflux RND transporter periplasmic adaptor subunit [Thiobacillus sp.]|nr:efflux RND transporter periplasmic adaptor subunit [Thiobacillus sp.]